VKAKNKNVKANFIFVLMFLEERHERGRMMVEMMNFQKG
jgi:hypothetical protein